MPISLRPSRSCPGTALRRSQPKRRAPSRRQPTRLRLAKGTPRSGSRAGSLRIRSSIGSRPSCSASSSMPHSKAISPGASPGARIHSPRRRSSRHQPVPGQPVRGGVERPGDDRASARELLEAGGGRADVVAERGQPPVPVGAEPDPLHHLRPMAGIAEHLLAGQRDLDRPAEHPRGQGGQHRVGMHRQLGAEAAADEGADDRGHSPAGCRGCWRCRRGNSPGSGPRCGSSPCRRTIRPAWRAAPSGCGAR